MRALFLAALLAFLVACSGHRRSGAAESHDAKGLFSFVERVVSRDATLAGLLAPCSQSLGRDGEGRIVNEGWSHPNHGAWSALGVRVPDAADEPLLVGKSRFDRLQLGMKLLGAHGEPAAIHEGRVLYQDVFPHTDRIVAASSRILEDLLVLHDEKAPHAFAWRVDLPEGIARAAVQESGGLAFLDALDRTVLALRAPYLLDARGERHGATLGWEEGGSVSQRFGTLRIAFDPSRLEFPAVLDPTVELGAWTEVPMPEKALARAYHQMAFDTARGRVVLFGGRTANGFATGTWLWDGSTWSDAAPANSPSPRYGFGMAFDAVRGRVVLFGGRDEAGATNAETWLWDGANWSLAAPATSPPGRFGQSMAFDAARSVVVLFGGVLNPGTSFYLNETWLWNGTTWSRPTLASSPTARIDSAMTFDGVRNQIVLYGGSTAAATLTDTWLWNGTAWSHPLPATSPPSISSPSLAFDSVRGRAVLFGDANVVWLWNGVTWARVTPPTVARHRTDTAIAFDTVRSRVVLFGGMGSPFFADTWTWDGATWTSAGVPRSPPGRHHVCMVFDDVRKNIVLFGGIAQTAPLGDTWLWNGTVWSRTLPPLSPPARGAHAMVFDAARGQTVLFGGATDDIGTEALDDTWTWNGTTWAPASTAVAPPPRSRHAMAYDAARSRVVLFGGQDPARGEVGDTWLWDGGQWTELAPASSPTPRSQHAMVFDGARNEVILFGGIGFTTYSDTWRWNGVSWSAATPAVSPRGRFAHALAFDSTRGEVVLFAGGVLGLGGDRETWRWNGVVWSQAATPVAPPAREDHAMGYDSVRRQVVMFGGTGNADLWLFSYAGGVCAASADCSNGLACVDGVCCSASACGTCETCAGFDPGRCTPVANADDTDSCSIATGRSCDARGICKKALGSPATTPGECASGVVADGVCCDQRCDATCLACRAELKESSTLSGICDFAKAGADPHDACAADPRETCRYDGTCDGRGACRLYPKDAPCGPVACVDARATSRVCDGAGACSASAIGVLCGLYACANDVGCAARCGSDEACGVRAHCLPTTQTCVPDDSASCDGEGAVVSPDGTRTACGLYKCVEGACNARCDRITDCASGATCNFEGRCVPETQSLDSGGGCSASSSRATAAAYIVFGAFAAALRIPRRRRRGYSK